MASRVASPCAHSETTIDCAQCDKGQAAIPSSTLVSVRHPGFSPGVGANEQAKITNVAYFQCPISEGRPGSEPEVQPGNPHGVALPSVSGTAASHIRGDYSPRSGPKGLASLRGNLPPPFPTPPLPKGCCCCNSTRPGPGRLPSPHCCNGSGNTSRRSSPAPRRNCRNPATG